MNDEVHDDEPAGGGGVLAEGVPAVDEDGDVVVPVEEDQLLLPQHDEDGVPQLGHLGQHEHPGPEPAHSVVLDEAGNPYGIKSKLPCLMAGIVFWSPGYTQRVVDAVSAEGEDELWQGAGRAQDAEHRQHQVPGHQWPPQVEGLPATPCIHPSSCVPGYAACRP